jgi:hypothetical protein
MPTPEAKATMARAYASGETPKLDSVSPNGRNEIWSLANVLFLLPVIPPGAPAELEYALRLRRDASLGGQCDECGASFDVAPADELDYAEISTGLFAHRGNCLAADENIIPLMDAYDRARSSVSVDDEIAVASRETRDKIAESLVNRIDVKVTGKVEARVKRLLDEKLARSPNGCGHLKSRPIQTWHIFLFDDVWRCDECWLRFASSMQDRGLRLSPLEESTCDYCRRFSPTSLAPTVSRVGTFVLYGAACRRCAQDFGVVDESVEATK